MNTYTLTEVQAIAAAAQNIRDVVTAEDRLRVRVCPAIEAMCATSVAPEQIDASELEVEFIRSPYGWRVFSVLRY